MTTVNHMANRVEDAIKTQQLCEHIEEWISTGDISEHNLIEISRIAHSLGIDPLWLFAAYWRKILNETSATNLTNATYPNAVDPSVAGGGI